MIVVFLCIAVVAVMLFIQYFMAKQFEVVAKEKGYTDTKYFHFCFWLGIAGYLLVIALPDRGKYSEVKKPQTNQTINKPVQTNSGYTSQRTTNTNPSWICQKCGRANPAGQKACWNCKETP